MAQPGIDVNRVQQLEELLKKKEEESHAIKAELNRVRSSVSAAAVAAANAAALGFDPTSNDYQMSSSSASLLRDSGRSRSNMVPRTAAPVLGLKAEHVQPLVRLLPPCKLRRFSTHTDPTGASPAHEAVQNNALSRVIDNTGHGTLEFESFRQHVGKIGSAPQI